MNQEDILMFLDFEKAFDLVEWNFLFKSISSLQTKEGQRHTEFHLVGFENS